MRHLIFTLAAAGAALTLGACTKAEQARTEDNVQKATADVVAAGKEVADSPVVEKAGESLKEAAQDTGTVLKDAAKGAVSGAKQGMAKVDDNRHSDGSTTTTTTTTVETKKN
ncbi:hypothetical protein [uncultured Phenylobacterium sp.]|uniref:hypothetical protein n=1 Tax=uncultured Phenylobacterium sp. TaxID=349273 RepID=UPI0025EBFBC3|nr:hypothetical protein [uncultured Phenylobacterium sp.]